MAPFVIPAAIVAGLGALYVVTRPSAKEKEAEAAAAKAKADAAAKPAFPADLKPDFDRLLNAPPDQDPAALEVVAARLEALGFQEQATALRLKAAQLRAAQGASVPAAPAPKAAPAPSPAPAPKPAPAPEVRFVPGVLDEPAPAPAPKAAPPPSRVHVPIPTRTLRSGMTGADVKQWQEFLIFIAGPTVVGPSGADGIYGPATAKATAAFQRSVALTDDGIAGPNTFKAALAAGY